MHKNWILTIIKSSKSRKFGLCVISEFGGSEVFSCMCAQAEQQLQKKGKGKVRDMLEKAAEQLMSCFRVCASDK